jgi:hypothetical protein
LQGALRPLPSAQLQSFKSASRDKAVAGAGVGPFLGGQEGICLVGAEGFEFDRGNSRKLLASRKLTLNDQHSSTYTAPTISTFPLKRPLYVKFFVFFVSFVSFLAARQI